MLSNYDLVCVYWQQVGTVLGPEYYTLLCLVIITSALSTLDSTFSAVAKAVGPDLHGFITTGKPVNPSLATEFEVMWL